MYLYKECINPQRKGCFYDPCNEKTPDELAAIFGGDAEKLQRLCSRLFCLGMSSYTKLYYSAYLSVSAVRANRRPEDETLHASRDRLRKLYPMAAAKERYARQAHQQEKRRAQDGIAIIAKKHGVQIVQCVSHKDQFEIIPEGKARWEKLGEIHCM